MKWWPLKQFTQPKSIRPLAYSTYSVQSEGFALPMALILGLIMVTLMSASLIDAFSSRDSSKMRQSSNISSITSDSAVARVLLELAKPENSELLVRNYDPINPDTGENYLGADGLLSSADETTTQVDEWTGYDRSGLPCYQQLGLTAPSPTLSGTIGPNDQYQLLAYRYDPAEEKGTLLVEGIHGGARSHVLLSISIYPIVDNFPGIAIRNEFPGSTTTAGNVSLRGREILGKKGNIYTRPVSSKDSTLTGKSAPGDSTRADYLDTLWSSPLDGAATDTIAGSIYACDLNIDFPAGVRGTNQGHIVTDRTFSGTSGSTTLYSLDSINLSGSDVLEIDTTDGPVTLEFNPASTLFSLRDNAKIVNIRTDGQPPQVGDAKIIIRNDVSVALYDQSCITQVFLYSAHNALKLLTDGPGCPSGQNTNFEGVAWVEAVMSSKNHVHNRDVNYTWDNGVGSPDDPGLTTHGATSGIAVPDEVSSLVDMLQYTDLPRFYRYQDILTWQKVSL